jgi:hypothetical protein
MSEQATTTARWASDSTTVGLVSQFAALPLDDAPTPPPRDAIEMEDAPSSPRLSHGLENQSAWIRSALSSVQRDTSPDAAIGQMHDGINDMGSMPPGDERVRSITAATAMVRTAIQREAECIARSRENTMQLQCLVDRLVRIGATEDADWMKQFAADATRLHDPTEDEQHREWHDMVREESRRYVDGMAHMPRDVIDNAIAMMEFGINTEAKMIGHCAHRAHQMKTLNDQLARL